MDRLGPGRFQIHIYIATFIGSNCISKISCHIIITDVIVSDIVFHNDFIMTALVSSAADLDKAEANYERAKNELEQTLEELKDM